MKIKYNCTLNNDIKIVIQNNMSKKAIEFVISIQINCTGTQCYRNSESKMKVSIRKNHEDDL